MIVRNTTQVGNEVIRRKAKLISRTPSASTRKTVRKLIDSMRYHGLVGMAAPQIGISQRIFVTEIRKTNVRKPKEADPVRVFINPRIISRSKNQIFAYEGCGSVANAGLFGKVGRSGAVTIRALNEKGERFSLRATGLLARIIQHEYDHLEGKIFLDRSSDTKSLMSREEYLKR